MRKEITDISTLFGIISALGLVLWAVFSGAQNIEGGPGVGGFFDVKSIYIVLGGTFFLTIACFTVKDVYRAFGSVTHTILYFSDKPREAALISLELANIARTKGLLELQKHKTLMEKNPFLFKGLSLVVDGLSAEDTENIMRKEINATLQRHETSTRILHKSAEIAPAMGLIGTLIGLVLMLGNLNEPETIGPSMAIALLTTLYGAMLSYMVLTPLATKLERNTRNEAKIMFIYLNSITSIGQKENPRRLQMIINAALPPAQRVSFFT